MELRWYKNSWLLLVILLILLGLSFVLGVGAAFAGANSNGYLPVPIVVLMGVTGLVGMYSTYVALVTKERGPGRTFLLLVSLIPTLAVLGMLLNAVIGSLLSLILGV